ncbi:MAG: ROK family transcriptional regulator [Xylanivirga thermophila]|jgi:predicted NBD/HSP70 family sugar kinase|uniref:ROK family transcriptional regulator n=1 Tax=Xylanivirga thermophila TaxID=2496273 RepID=UPI0039F45025
METNNILSKLDTNTMGIFNIIRHNGPLTVTGLMEVTQTPRTTLNRNIKELLERKLIKQEGTDSSSGGRPPALFSVNPDGVYTIGMELSRSNIRLLICNTILEPIWIYDMPINTNSTPEEVFPKIFSILNDAIDASIPDKQRLIGTGIGSVGPLDLKKGILLNPSSFPNTSWTNINLKELFESNLKIPTFVENGASTAVMGEYAKNASKGIHNIIYINVGVGMRCGVVLRGHLLGGDGNAEGAFAHMVLKPGGRSCYCGNYGCAESYVTIPAIIKEFQYELRKGKESILMSNMSVDEITFKDICTAAKNNDFLATEVIENAAVYTGLAIANIINVLHPQMIVLGGMIPDNSKYYYNRTIEVAKKNIYNPGHLKYVFCPPSLGHNTIAAGAAALALSKYVKGGFKNAV